MVVAAVVVVVAAVVVVVVVVVAAVVVVVVDVGPPHSSGCVSATRKLTSVTVTSSKRKPKPLSDSSVP